jgi:hypothetical protein
MSRKFNPLFTLLFFFTLFIAGGAAFGQSERVPAPKPLVLGCCKCLGGSNTLDLSTIAGNPWTVSGNPAIIQTTFHPAWNNNPGPAKWVSTTAGGGNGGVLGGTYVYQIRFTVPNCTIDQRSTIAGNLGGDDDIAIRLDNPSGPPIAQCTGGWCFHTPNHPAIPFTVGVGPGNHTLYVTVVNGGTGPSGMFVNAILTAKCTGEPVKPGMEPVEPRQ